MAGGAMQSNVGNPQIYNDGDQVSTHTRGNQQNQTGRPNSPIPFCIKWCGHQSWF